VQGPPQAEARTIPAAGGVVLDDASRILVVRRGRPPSAGEWTLPGGRVEDGESPEVAAAREVLEETAVEARVVAPLGVVIIVREGVVYAIHEFLMSSRGDQPPRAGDDASDARWVIREDLEGLGVRSDAIAVVDQGLALRRTIAPTA
jgi:8-oxo-dGTP diphosphatase